MATEHGASPEAAITTNSYSIFPPPTRLKAALAKAKSESLRKSWMPSIKSVHQDRVKVGQECSDHDETGCGCVLSPANLHATPETPVCDPSQVLHSTSLTSNESPNPTQVSTKDEILINGMRVFNKEVDDAVEGRFLEIRQQLEDALLQHFLKKRVAFRPLTLQLLLLGHNEELTKPCIVIRCPHRAKRNVERFLAEAFIRNMCAGSQSCKVQFDTAVIGRPIEPSGSEKLDEVFFDQPYIIEPFEDWTLRIKVIHSGTFRYATMGGFVSIVDHNGKKSCFGLTAGHILPADELYDEEYNDDDNEDRIPVSDLHTPKSPYLSLPRFEDYSNNQGGRSCASLGNMSEASYSTRAKDRDWALIKITSFPKQRFFDTEELPSSLPSVVATRPKGKQRAIIRGISYITCTVSSQPARALLPSGSKFVDVNVLHPDLSDDLPEGSSGSWVIGDSLTESLPVFGALVATDSFGCLWMVPMTDILEDIREEFQAAKVQLASSFEAENVECQELVTPALAGISTLSSNDKIPELIAESSKIVVNHNQHESEENPRVTEDFPNLATQTPPSLAYLSTCGDCGWENHESPGLAFDPDPTASSPTDHDTGVQSKGSDEVLQSNAWSSFGRGYAHWKCQGCTVYQIQMEDGLSTYRWQCCQCAGDNSCNFDAGCANCG